MKSVIIQFTEMLNTSLEAESLVTHCKYTLIVLCGFNNCKIYELMIFKVMRVGVFS